MRVVGVNMEGEKFFLQPGFIIVSKEPHLVHTVLGSCVSVCLWDNQAHFGGMNHFLFGRDRNNERTARFGSVSIPHLYRLMLDYGASRNCLQAHILGGGQHAELNSHVGTENVAVAEEILKKFGIEVLTRDVGGQIGRKVIFNTESGEILVFKVNKIRESDWYYG